nr:hypothetical protein 2 [Red mite virga-like virus 1]
MAGSASRRIVTRTLLRRPAIRQRRVYNTRTIPPTITVAPVTSSQPITRKRSRKDVLSGISDSLASAFRDPTTLVFALFAFVVAVDYTNNPTDNVIIRLGNHFGPDTFIGRFLHNNGTKFVGMLMLVPGALSAPKSHRFIVVGGVLFAAYTLPAVSYLSYALCAIALRIFFKTNNTDLRMLVTVLAAASLFATVSRSGVNAPLENVPPPPAPGR